MSGCILGLDKICSAKFDQNGQPEEEILQAKYAVNLLKKKQNWERMSSLPAKLLESSKAIGFRLVLSSSAMAERVFSILCTTIHSSAAVMIISLSCYNIIIILFNCKKEIAK